MKNSIKAKFKFVMLIGFLSLSIIFISIFWFFHNRVEEREISKSKLLIRTLIISETNMLIDEIFDKRIESLILHINKLKKTKGVLEVYVYDDIGVNILEKDSLNFEARNEFDKDDAFYFSIDKSRDILTSIGRLIVIGETIGYIKIDFSINEIYEVKRNSLIFLISFILLSAIFILSILRFYLQRKIINPIQKLTEMTKNISEKSLDNSVIIASPNESFEQLEKKLNKAGDNEIKVLKYSFKIMLKKINDYAGNLEKMVNEKTIELRKANDELKDFTYIVSHDLRAPLVNIKGFNSELKYSLKDIRELIEKNKDKFEQDDIEEIDYIFNEDLQESIKFIEASSTRMDKLINSILKISRIGNMKLHFEELDLKEIIEEIIASLTHQIKEKEIEIKVDHLPDIFSDKIGIKRVFGNLIDNAIKYCDPNKKSVIIIKGEEQDDFVSYIIEDNGKGIKNENLAKIFDIFHREEKTGLIKGEGMGLTYVKSLVEKLHGKIKCESELGSGTTFYLTFKKQEK